MLILMRFGGRSELAQSLACEPTAFAKQQSSDSWRVQTWLGFVFGKCRKKSADVFFVFCPRCGEVKFKPCLNRHSLP